MVHNDYTKTNFCIKCRISISKVFIKCPECGKCCRYKAHRNTHRINNYARYGIAFIPIAIIVCSSLYNIAFI